MLKEILFPLEWCLFNRVCSPTPRCLLPIRLDECVCVWYSEGVYRGHSGAMNSLSATFPLSALHPCPVADGGGGKYSFCRTQLGSVGRELPSLCRDDATRAVCCIEQATHCEVQLCRKERVWRLLITMNQIKLNYKWSSGLSVYVRTSSVVGKM